MRCNYCGADDAKTAYDLPPFFIVECRSCGLAYTNPRLSAQATEAEMYGAEFWEDYEAQYEVELASVRDFARNWLDRLREYAPAKPSWRVLEIGPGLGGFLSEAQAQGHEVHGLEPSEHAIAYARDRLGVNSVIRGTVDSLPEHDLPKMDVVIMLAVIEHLHDPLGALRIARDQLADDGVLFLSTGVWRSFNHRVCGKAWSIIAPEGHLYYFSKRTMGAHLERAGFRVAALTTNQTLINRRTNNRALDYVFNNRVVAGLRIPELIKRLALGDEMFLIAGRAAG